MTDDEIRKVTSMLDDDRIQAKRRRHLLKVSKYNRQLAVANFPRQAIQLAIDMHKAISLKEGMNIGKSRDDCQEHIDTLERHIVNLFRATFGRDLFEEKESNG